MRLPTPMEALGLIIVLLVALSVYRAHRDTTVNFSLLDLLMQNGRVDRIACVTMGTWFALVYVFVGTYIDGKMTEGLYTAFGGLCFAPMIAKMFSGSTSTTVVAQSSSTEITQEKK